MVNILRQGAVRRSKASMEYRQSIHGQADRVWQEEFEKINQDEKWLTENNGTIQRHLVAYKSKLAVTRGHMWQIVYVPWP